MNPVREQNIKAGSFTVIDEDDVYYLDTICSLFRKGKLVVEDEKVLINLGITEKNPNTITGNDIIAILKNGNFLKMKKELSEINEPHAIALIYQIAKNMANELSGAKLKYISGFCGRDILIDEISD
jgi:hypothetical protein